MWIFWICRNFDENKENKLKYVSVPFLHSNQSTVENLFSQLRAFDRDKPELIGKGLLATNINGQFYETTKK